MGWTWIWLPQVSFASLIVAEHPLTLPTLTSTEKPSAALQIVGGDMPETIWPEAYCRNGKEILAFML
jgi:hypothetical protein